MSAYQNFLSFFSMHNKERLDGLSESYFDGMTLHERNMAFNFLLKMVESGGSEESINGLFLADQKRAVQVVTELLKKPVLRDESRIAAAWNLFRVCADINLLPIFFELFSSPDKKIRAAAAYYVPSTLVTPELIACLQGMIRTETDTLARINAVNKLLQCYGITRDSLGKEEFSRLYKGLRSEDINIVNKTFNQLETYRN